MDSIISVDEPPRMGKRPTESGGEPSSSNCGYSAEGQAHQLTTIKKAASKFEAAFFIN